MLESSKGSGNRVATMLSDADVAQLSRKHSRLVQQSARDPALAGETDFPRRFMTAVWSCVAWTASGVAPVTVSAEAACPAEHPLAIAVAPCPIRDSVISAANSVLLVFFSIRRFFLTGVTMNQQPAYSTENHNCDGLTRIRFCAPVRISLGFG